MSFCLPPKAASAFKTKLKSREINPAMLAGMTSKERNAFFSGFLTKEQATATNALFESKTLLKNQQQGMITWAKTVSGLKPEARKELIDKINKLDTVLTPEDEASFLADLAGQRLGVGVTAEEAQKIADLAKKVNDAKLAMADSTRRVRGKAQTEAEKKFGDAQVALNNYVSDLKVDAQSLKLSDFKSDTVGSAGKLVSEIGGNLKAGVASLDNSAPLNQGWKVFFTNPPIAFKNFLKTYEDIVNSLGGKNVADMVNSSTVSHPDYSLAKKGGLAIGNVEEAFPKSWLENIDKIPKVGKLLTPLARLYKASQDAYTAFLHRTRMDIFGKNLEIAEKFGVDMDKENLQSISMVINSLTGRGGFGKFEGPTVEALNNLFFSPRFFKSQIDVLTHPLGRDLAGGKLTPFARKQAVKNLMKVVAGSAAFLGLMDGVAKMFGNDDAVEWDTRSSDSGAIKIGDTRYKIGGGLPGLITLLSRIIPTPDGKGGFAMQTKSTTNDKVYNLNTGEWGSRTVGDVLGDFAGNKLAPLGQLIDDWYITGVDFDGEKPTVTKSALKLITPFGVQTYNDLAKDPKAEKFFTMLLAGHGINVSNYGPK